MQTDNVSNDFPVQEVLVDKKPKNNFRRWASLIVVMVYLFGLVSGYVVWGRPQQVSSETRSETGTQGDNNSISLAILAEQINPPDGYNLAITYGDLGPQLIAAGAIDYLAFINLYESAGNPLTNEHIEILTQTTDKPIIINAENAHFLLNFFWAVGLVNANPILTEGPITQYSEGQVERFASTGGWTLGTKPVSDLFASQILISLTPEQQVRVEEAAALIYRPCCNNPTLFPDCNHGMAMLGLLELMASQGATTDEMLQAAKYVNAFWFPQQALEIAQYLEATQGMNYQDADASLIVGKEMSSGSGFGAVHQYLQTSGLLPQTPGGSSSCSN